MSKIVISSNKDNLDKILKNDTIKEYFYISVDLGSFYIEDYLRSRGCKKIDINNGLNGIDFKKEYIDFIGRLNCKYNSAYWLASSISYKGTFVSDLSTEIYNYYCAISFIKKKDFNYIIISDNFVLNSYLKKYCVENKIECVLLDAQKSENSIVHFRRCCLSNIYFLYQGWSRKILADFYLSRGIRKSIKNDKSYYVLRSWIGKRSFLEDNSYRDLFFGQLPDYIKSKGVNLIILAGILNDYRKTILKIKCVKEFLIIPQEYFVGYLDYLKVLMLVLFKRPKIDVAIKFCGLEVADFLKNCLRKDYENVEINKNLIYYYYAKALLNKINASSFTFTFENQAWEKMTIRAIRNISPETKITGYSHVAISQSWLSYFYSKEEENIIPLPDRILTIGEESSRILSSSGNYINKLDLSEACALRYEYIFKRDKLNRNRNGKILAAFSIDTTYSLKLLKLLCDTLSNKDKYQVILRSHPLTPVEIIAEKYGIKLNSNFQISRNLKFEQDLKEASLIIYVDTTSSAEALMSGIPAINVDFKDPVNPDPLFKLNNFKFTVSSEKELCEKIDYIYGMPDSEYSEKYNSAMSYLKKYFHPVEEKYLERFLS